MMHRRVSRGQRGQSLVEYALIIVLVTIIAMVVIFVLGPDIVAAYQNIRNAI
jgi:Flp pilus assembly pilin Flp